MLIEASHADKTGGSKDGGFALIETLVSLAILVMALSVFYAVFADGLRRAGRAQKVSEAALQAQSLLARVGADLLLDAGLSTGSLPDGLQWQLRIEPYGDASDRKAWPAAAYRVTVAVLPQDGAQERPLVELATLRLGQKEERR
jgi:general secretion pathway protein I